MSLLTFFEWCYQTDLGEAIRQSTGLFPVIEAFHPLGLSVVIGSVLIVNLRLFGVGLSKQPAAQLWTLTRPWLLGGVALMFASGIPLFMSEAIKCYYSFPFWVKMTSLVLVLIFTFTVVRRATLKDVTGDGAALGRSTALISLLLWFGVAWGGRWIGFS